MRKTKSNPNFSFALAWKIEDLKHLPRCLFPNTASNTSLLFCNRIQFNMRDKVNLLFFFSRKHWHFGSLFVTISAITGSKWLASKDNSFSRCTTYSAYRKEIKCYITIPKMIWLVSIAQIYLKFSLKATLSTYWPSHRHSTVC